MNSQEEQASHEPGVQVCRSLQNNVRTRPSRVQSSGFIVIIKKEPDYSGSLSGGRCRHFF